MTTLPRTGLSGDDEVSAGLLSSTALKDESSFKKLSPTLIEKYNTSLTLNGPTSPSASSPASSSEKLPQQQQINSEKSSSPSFSHPPLITSTYAEGSGALSTFSPPPQTSSLSINNAEINNSGELLSPVATRQQLAKSGKYGILILFHTHPTPNLAPQIFSFGSFFPSFPIISPLSRRQPP